jgi:hypothetical protein
VRRKRETILLVSECSGSTYGSLAEAQDAALPVLADLVADVIRLRRSRDCGTKDNEEEQEHD